MEPVRVGGAPVGAFGCLAGARSSPRYPRPTLMPDTLYFLLADGTTYAVEVEAGTGARHRDAFTQGQNPYNQAFATIAEGILIRTNSVVALELVPEGAQRLNIRT
jgi:hypothetical protein